MRMGWRVLGLQILLGGLTACSTHARTQEDEGGAFGDKCLAAAQANQSFYDSYQVEVNRLQEQLIAPNPIPARLLRSLDLFHAELADLAVKHQTYPDGPSMDIVRPLFAEQRLGATYALFTLLGFAEADMGSLTQLVAGLTIAGATHASLEAEQLAAMFDLQVTESDLATRATNLGALVPSGFHQVDILRDLTRSLLALFTAKSLGKDAPLTEQRMEVASIRRDILNTCKQLSEGFANLKLALDAAMPLFLAEDFGNFITALNVETRVELRVDMLRKMLESDSQVTVAKLKELLTKTNDLQNVFAPKQLESTFADGLLVSAQNDTSLAKELIYWLAAVVPMGGTSGNAHLDKAFPLDLGALNMNDPNVYVPERTAALFSALQDVDKDLSRLYALWKSKDDSDATLILGEVTIGTVTALVLEIDVQVRKNLSALITTAEAQTFWTVSEAFYEAFRDKGYVIDKRTGEVTPLLTVP